MDFKSYCLRIPVYTLLLLAAIIKGQDVVAQNVTSPYSILGIGDIDNRDYGRYSISGSAGISRRNDAIYNYSNPASLTSLSLKVVNFDLVGRAKLSAFKSGDTLSTADKDFAISRISLAFRPSSRFGFAFGLKPYSSVNYKYSQSTAIYNDGSVGYTKSIEGSGGINQIYGSGGYALSKHFSVGLTGAYMFGTTKKSTTYLDENIGLDITNEDYSFYSGANVLLGLQYYSASKKPWQHTVGLTISKGTDLNGYAKSEYIQADTTFLEESKGDVAFKMPVSVGLGYTATNNHGLSISVQGDYYHWPEQKINYSNSYTSPSLRLAAGWEYSKRSRYYLSDASYEKYYLGMGVAAQNSYYTLKGNKIWDYALTLGGGYNLTGNLYFHGGLEFGVKGSNKQGQIQERYTQFNMGVTIRDVWFRTSSSRND
ncbi:MAG: hypothetical protein QM640_04695 [Niabella sp.]